MIIFRYFAKEVFATLLFLMVILLVIFLSNQVAHYLTMTASGKIAGMQLLHLVILEIPSLLSLILPLSLFLAILLTYGRLYVDNEMIVLMACGVGERRFLGITMIFAVCVAVPVMILTLWLNPIVANARNQLLAQINTASVLQTLMPGRFQATYNGQRIFYIENMSDDRQQLKNIFVAEQANSSDPTIQDTWTVMTAHGGHHYEDPVTKERFVVADDGYRYQGEPGTKNFTLIHFDQYGVRIDTPTSAINDQIDSVPTVKLWQLANKHKLEDSAEFQWRVSFPISVFILALLALPLSHVAPRHGRFARLFPSILIYIFYANMMIVGQNWIANGTLTPKLGLWVMHFVMLLLGIFLFIHQSGWLRYWRTRFSAPRVAV